MNLEVMMAEKHEEIKLGIDAESTLEDYLFKKMQAGKCPITGSTVHRVVRQAATGGYGIVDLMAYFYGVDKSGERVADDEIHVYELKKGKLDKAAFCQIARYKRAFERAIEYGSLEIDPSSVYYHLVGADVCAADDTVYLVDACADWLSVHRFIVSLESGIRFEQSCGWHQVKENTQEIATTIDSLIAEIEDEHGKINSEEAA